MWWCEQHESPQRCSAESRLPFHELLPTSTVITSWWRSPKPSLAARCRAALDQPDAKYLHGRAAKAKAGLKDRWCIGFRKRDCAQKAFFIIALLHRKWLKLCGGGQQGETGPGKEQMKATISWRQAKGRKAAQRAES